MNIKPLIISATGLAVIASAQAVTILSENFDSLTPGDTGATTGAVQAANSATSIVVDAATVPAFTTASGNALLVSVGDNNFAALRPSMALLNFAAVANTDIFTFTYDLYIPTALDVPIGGLNPRLEAAPTPGNGATFRDQEQSAVGVYAFSFTGPVSDFINGAGPADSARPFIFFEQKINGMDDGTTSDVAYIDNINFEINAVPEPSSALLIGLGGFILMRRRR